MKSSVVNTIIVHYLCRKLVQELSYDAWGRLRDPETRELYSLEDESTPMFGRGFTGHEHIAGFRLVNMNARLYDPMTGRMLSPDSIVQSPYFSQNHNRHSYCLNNPLAFTDPTGMKIVYDMTDEDKELWDIFISYFEDGTPFMQLLEILEKSDEIITIKFGETILNGQGEHYQGQYNATTNVMIFEENTKYAIQPLVATEELYHAYQDIFAYLMKDQIWNREFEAKIASNLIVSTSLRDYTDCSNLQRLIYFIKFRALWYTYSLDFYLFYMSNGYYFREIYLNITNYNVPVINIPETFYKLIYEIKW